jgi:hypothetical protein
MNIWGKLKTIFTGRRFWRTFLISLITVGLLIVGLFGRDISKLFDRPGASKADIVAAWAMAGNNPQGTHFSAFNGPSAVQVKWGDTGSNNLTWDITSGPVIGTDGTLYVSTGQELWALNPDGTTKWKYFARTGLSGDDTANTQYWINTAPALASDGTIYVGLSSVVIVGSSGSSLDHAGTGRLLALTDTGTAATIKWVSSNLNSVSSNLIVDSSDTVYFGDRGDWQNKSEDNAIDIFKDARIRAFDSTGTEKWNYSVGNRNTSIRSLVMSNDESSIYAVDSGHQTALASVSPAKLYALSSNNGSLAWTFDEARGYGSPIAVASNGNIYVGCGSAATGNSPTIPTQICALNASGVEQWRYGDGTGTDFRMSTYGGLAVGPDDTIYVGSSALANDTSACASGQCKLHAISSTGTLRWAFPLANYFAAAPAIGHDGTVYIGSAPTYYAISSAGASVWQYTPNNFLINNDFGQFSPSIASDGTLYLPTWRRIIALAGSGGNSTTAGVTVTPTTGTTSEAATTFEFTVVLNTAPTADVVMGVVSSDATMHEGVVDKTSLTFTPTNWNTPQTVRVTGVDDTQADGNQTYTIRIENTNSDDANYDMIDPADVTVTNTDNDGAVATGVTITPITGTTTEAGGTFDFTVVLDKAPTADVTVGLSSSDTTEGTINKTSVTFTPANWNVAQTVRVTGVDDSDVDGNVSYNIVTADTVTTDSSYWMNPIDVTVLNTDNDTVVVALDRVEITPVTATIAAGQTQSFNVVAKDVAGNSLTGVTFSWTATGGMLNRTDGASVIYAAGAIDNVFNVTVTGTLGSVTKTATAQVTITAGSVEPPIVIQPPVEPPTLIQPPADQVPLSSSGPESIWLLINAGVSLSAALIIYRRKRLMN